MLICQKKKKKATVQLCIQANSTCLNEAQNLKAKNMHQIRGNNKIIKNEIGSDITKWTL